MLQAASSYLILYCTQFFTKNVLWPVGIWFCGFMTGSTGVVLDQVKTSKKVGQRLKVSSDRLVEPVIELRTNYCL